MMPILSRSLQAILLMLLAMACLSSMNVFIRLLSPELASTQMVLLRNIGSFILILLWTSLISGGKPRFATTRIRSHFWRASVGIVAMELWFYSVTIMPLTLATALSFTTPIFSTIFAMLFLGERVGVHRLSAIIAGFVGMLVILRPDMGLVNPSAAIVLLSSGMMAIAGVLVKSLTRTEAPETIVFYMSLFMIPWSIPLALLHWQPLTVHHIALIAMVTVLSTAAHLLMTRAYIRADMVILMPVDFTRLIFTAILAYILFGETLDTHTISGALIIVASTVYIAHREAKKSAIRATTIDISSN
ncbi:MAG: DMT family transporter [Rickettsiales bacterium]|nr:DMT family transporter [Rickettsiales bacterium]